MSPITTATCALVAPSEEKRKRPMKRIAMLGCAVLLVAACSKKEDATKDEPKGAATTATKPAEPKGDGKTDVTLTLDGKEYKLGYATARQSATQGMKFVLTSVPMKCADTDAPADAVGLEFSVFAGPGGKYYAGSPTTTPASTVWKKPDPKPKASYLSNDSFEVTLDPLTLKAGEHARGSLHLAYPLREKEKEATATGKFDAEICKVDGDATMGVFDEKPADGPVAGTAAAKPFTAKSVLIDWGHSPSMDYLSWIYFFEGDVTCETLKVEKAAGKTPYVFVGNYAGANSSQKLVGAWQSAGNLNYRGVKAKPEDKIPESTYGSSAAVRFDALDFKDGGTVKGQLLAQSGSWNKKPEDALKLGGNFEGKLCKF